MGNPRHISSFSVLLVTAALSLLGLFSLRGLRLSYTPEPKRNILQVQMSMPDASPAVMEAEVTSRVEAVLSGMGGVRSVSSSSSMGHGQVTVELDRRTDLQVARFEASTRIASIWPSLPKDARYPYLTAGGGGQPGGRLVYRLRSPLPSSRIAAFARDRIVYPLSAVPGVDKVSVSGATPYHWVITFDYAAAQSLGITGEDIAEAIQLGSRNEIAGMVTEHGRLQTIRLATRETEGFLDIPVKNVGGRIVTLGEIASASFREQIPQTYFRLNGLNTVTVSVDISPSANLLTAASAVRGTMSQIHKGFPPEITASLSYDASEYIAAELDKIFLRTLLCLAILLVFSFLANRSWRQMVILLLSLLCGLLISLGIYRLAGLPVHIYTLAGITVSFGIMIDTSILMTDHYGRHRDRSAFPSIFYAVITTVAALLMVLLLPERERLNLTDFLWAVSINLAVSLAICYWFVPALMDSFAFGGENRAIPVRRLRRRARLRAFYERWIRMGIRWRPALIVLIVMAFGIPLFLIPQATEFPPESKSLLARIARWEPYAENRHVIDRIAGSSLGLFFEGMDRSNFYREPDRKVLYIQAGMPEGCSAAQLNEVIVAMENFLAQFPQIESFTTQIHSHADGRIEVRFKDEWERTSFPSQLKAKVTGAAINFGGANWRISGIDDNYFNNNIVTDYKTSYIQISGYNFEELYGYARQMVDELSRNKRVSGPEIWSGGWQGRPRTQLHLAYDRQALSAAGVSPGAYYRALSSRLFDASAGEIMYDGQMTDIDIRSSDADDFDLWHVLRVPIRVDSAEVSLGGIGSLEKKRSAIDIQRVNQAYSIRVFYDFIGTWQHSRKVAESTVRQFNESVLPVGYKASLPEGWSGSARKQRAWLLGIIILVLFTMLSIALESLRLPLAVIGMIPVSFIGLFLTFGLSDFSFDQGGFAALVMLCGLTVNAGIYILSEYGALRGGEQVHRYVRAFGHKIVPISLTILSTVLGLIPFLSDGPSEVFWFDLAIGTISGLLFSVVALLVFFPVFALRRR